MSDTVEIPEPARLLSGEDYLALPREANPHVIDELLPLGGSMCVFGEAKVGKSFAALQLAHSIIQGTDWMDIPITTPGSVAYIQLDTPRNVWQARIDKLHRLHGIDLRSVIFGDRESLDTWPFNILDDTHFTRLKEALARLDPTPVVVIMDTLRECHQMDENDSTAMQQVMARLTEVAKPSALVLIHHGRKPKPDAPDGLMTGARGSNYIMGRVDAVVRFTRKSVHYSGRSIEEATLKLVRQPSQFWTVQNDETESRVRELLKQHGNPTAAARAWSEENGKPEEANRTTIRRYMKKGQGKP